MVAQFFKYGNEWNEYIVNGVDERCNGSAVLEVDVFSLLLEEKLIRAKIRLKRKIINSEILNFLDSIATLQSDTVRDSIATLQSDTQHLSFWNERM